MSEEIKNLKQSSGQDIAAQPEADSPFNLGDIVSSETQDFDDLFAEFVVPENQDEGSTDESEGVIKVKFNKKKLKFTSKEAVPFVEMGLKWSSFKDDYKKLAMLSNLHSFSVREFINRLFDSSSSIIFNRTLEECGGNEAAARLMFEERLKNIGGAGDDVAFSSPALKQEKDKLKSLLISGFKELSDAFPEKFKSIEQLPTPIIQDALKNRRSLLDSFLRHNFHEISNIKKQIEKQIEIGTRSAGSLQSNRAEAVELASFEKAFRNALK